MSNSEGISQAEVNKAIETALAEITKAGSIAELKKAKGSILGDGSALAGFSAKLGKLAADQKAEAGKIVGSARAKVTEAFEARESVLSAAEEAKLLEKEAIDITALGRIARTGARHPLSLLQEKISDVFVGMGWEIAEGPEVESEWFNFDALNFDADHPARAMQDTFFVEPTEQKLVLRTHTSPVQVRSMLDREVPIYVLCPGRVFRTDELDATHTPVFHQVEGLAIDKGLSMANLRGTLEHFARIMFGEEAKIRLRPSFFPFTKIGRAHV